MFDAVKIDLSRNWDYLLLY